MTIATTRRPAATMKHSTPQQAVDPLDAAIDRATRWGVRVLATGRVKSTGQRFWIVSSSSDAAHPHLCFRLATGRISCDCQAGRRGRVCQHVAAVVMHETVQADRRRRLAEEMEEVARDEREEAEEEETHLHAASRSLARTEAQLDRMAAHDAEQTRWLDDNMGGACIDACRGW